MHRLLPPGTDGVPGGTGCLFLCGSGGPEAGPAAGAPGALCLSTFPLSRDHGGAGAARAAQALAEWVRDFPVDLYRLRDKYCSGPHPKVLHGAPSLDHIFQELYAVPEQIKLPYFRIKTLELLLYLDALELPAESEKPYFYKTQVEKMKAIHRLLTGDLERHYTITELSRRFSIRPRP